jgi:hypothetical protein
MVKIGLEIFKSKAGGTLSRSLFDNFVSFILGFKELEHLNAPALFSAKIQKGKEVKKNEEERFYSH